MTVEDRPLSAGGPRDRIMKRRAFIASLTGGLLAAPLAAEAGQKMETVRLGASL